MNSVPFLGSILLLAFTCIGAEKDYRKSGTRDFRKTLYFATKSQLLTVERDEHDVLQSCHVTSNRTALSGLDEDDVIWASEELLQQLGQACNEFHVVQLHGRHREKRQFIYPGTKWCGPGSVAENPDDLGSAIETDKCCRDHDLYCGVYINPMETKYGLYNDALWTRLGCNCDRTFYNCLKEAAETETTADIVGTVYFNIVSNSCIKKDYPLICVRESIFGCQKYRKDKSKEKEWMFKRNKRTF